jgi:hypothetical protein
MKLGKVGKQMININPIPWSSHTKSEQVIDKSAKVDKRSIKWVDTTQNVRKEDLFIIDWEEPIDDFGYPELDELRKQYEASGLYSKKRINEIMKVYERLPKYRAQRKSAPRSRK